MSAEKTPITRAIEAAEAVVARWHSTVWKEAAPTAALIAELAEAMQALREGAAVPDGWKLVPIQESPAMRFALESSAPTEVIWQRVLAAAPPAPAPSVGAEAVAWEGPSGQLMPHPIFTAWRERYPWDGHEHYKPLVYATPASAPPAADLAEEVKRLRTEADKSERRAIAFGDIGHQQVIAMRAAVVASELQGPSVGMRWIANTLCGPGHLPDVEAAKALGGAQALFDKEMAEHEAFRAAHPGPGQPAAPAAPQAAPGVVEIMREALEQIERWGGFPDTGKTWPQSGFPMSYGACYGSDGERDFMRSVAHKALAAAAAHHSQAAPTEAMLEAGKMALYEASAGDIDATDAELATVYEAMRAAIGESK